MKKYFLCSRFSLLFAYAPEQCIVFAVAFKLTVKSVEVIVSVIMLGLLFLFFNKSSLVPKKVVWGHKK